MPHTIIVGCDLSHSGPYEQASSQLDASNRRMIAKSMNLTPLVDMYKKILDGKIPAFKEESDDYLIINMPAYTMKHPILDVDINEYVSNVLSSDPNEIGRSKSFFAVVAGVGKGKTRTLVEMQKKLNEVDSIFCLTITFNSQWEYAYDPEITVKKGSMLKFMYVTNVVARIISMNYHIPLFEAWDLLMSGLSDIDVTTKTILCLINECVGYIMNQYRSDGKRVNKFVLLVDECVAIQDELDEYNTMDIHKLLRNSLLSSPIILNDGSRLLTDLVMTG